MDPNQKPFKFVVRLPLQLRNQIAEAAKYYRRSMNSEIVSRLEHTFSGLPHHDETEQMEPKLHNAFEALFGGDLTNEEERLVRTYRRLSEEKRRALLKLLD